ncbi:hypothetical protein Dimus_036720, partial [Dionaea muscipula]
GNLAQEISFMMLRIRNKVHQRFKKRFQAASSTKFKLQQKEKALQESTLESYLRIPEVEMTRSQSNLREKGPTDS